MKMIAGKVKPTVLYLSYDGLTDSLGQAQILPYLKGLAIDYDITIITFEKSHAFHLHQDTIRTICSEYGLLWMPFHYHKRPPVLSTLYDMFLLRRMVTKLLSKRKIDIIHCRSYLTALTGLWAKRKFGVKFIFDMRGFWADERVDGGLWNLANPIYNSIYKYFKHKERQFISDADHVVSLTENAASEIKSWPAARCPITIIPTCVDMELFSPEAVQRSSDDVRRELQLSAQDFVLIYLGSWGTWYMTQDILDFFTVLSSNATKGATLLILTQDEPDLAGYPLADRVVVKRVRRNEVPAFLMAANATICFIKPSFSKRASSATKIAEAWAMNLPVVTNSGWGDIERLHDSGYPLYLCRDKSEYGRIAQQVLMKPAENKRGMLLGQFDLISGIAKYRSIYRSLAK